MSHLGQNRTKQSYESKRLACSCDKVLIWYMQLHG